jgi:hypothetical protein
MQARPVADRGDVGLAGRDGDVADEQRLAARVPAGEITADQWTARRDGGRRVPARQAHLESSTVTPAATPVRAIRLDTVGADPGGASAGSG